MTAEILQYVGAAWLLVAVGFFGGFVYLRVRSTHENLF